MATHEIKRFFRGPRTTVRRLNEVVDGLNTILKLDGDSFIRIDKSPSGFVIRLDIREVKKRLGPGKTVSEGGTGTSEAADIRVAYCKTDAPAAATMQCYLDTDHTGQEVTVCFSISKGGTQLSECAPLLKDGDPIQVYRSASGQWRCCQTFDRSVESELYLP